MARQIHRLSARSVATQTKIGRHADGNGLYLSISNNGGRRWVYLYRRDGRLREKGLGSANIVSLKDARQAADAIRKQLRDGIDPIDSKVKPPVAKTFAQCAESFISSNEMAWKNDKHRDQWRNTLKTYAEPHIGKLPIDGIDVNDVLKVLEPIWATKSETASRVRGRIERILDWAATRGYRSSENPARWRGCLSQVLPDTRKVTKRRHHPALPYKDIPAFMSDLRKRDAISARALEFTILTAARTGEVIGAKWDEIDTNNNVWTVPGDRMKGKIEHQVPLSDCALALLADIPKDSDFVFVGMKPDEGLSNMSMLAMLKRDRPDLTTHGFRSTFRDWAAETTEFPNEVVEMALAHGIRDKAEAAYRRGNLLERRRILMNAWAAYCEGS